MTVISKNPFTIEQGVFSQPSPNKRLGRWWGLVSLVSIACMSVDAYAQNSPRKSIEALRLSGEQIVIDGVLDEAVWQRAAVGSEFVERTPTPGAKPPADSRVRILYDEDAVILGLEMGLMPGETPVARTLSRESTRIWSDDAVTVKFDVRFGQRNLVGFGVNAAGATIDFVSLENGRVFRTEFDAVWEAKTSINQNAWVVEMRIPYTALGLPKRPGLQTLGLNIARDHNQRRATDDWSAIPRGFGPGSAVHCGQVVLEDVGAPTTLSVIPYLTLEVPGDNGLIEMGPLGAGAGSDFRLRLGEDVWGELTFLTDFAEVDLDAAVLNFSRFPLFLPEKRQFFLSGLDVFSFGRAKRTQLFFSRRVGLDADGGEVPIVAGGKIYGRAGKLAFGALEVLTGETEESPATSFSVARAYQDMGRLRLGSIVALRTRFDAKGPPPDEMPPADMTVPPNEEPATSETEGAALDHIAAGLDGTLRLAKDRLTISTFGALTLDRQPLPDAPNADARRGFAGALEADWKGAVFRPRLSLSSTDADFDPQIGFVQRRDITQGQATLEWDWRFEKTIVERMTLETFGHVDRTANLADTLGHGFGAELALTGRTGNKLSITAAESVDVVTAPFPLFGITVAAGDQVRRGMGLKIGTASQRNPKIEISGQFADGEDGQGERRIGGQAVVNFGPHFRVNAGGFWEQRTVLQDTTDLLVDLESLRGGAGIVVAASPDFSADFVIQGTTARRVDNTLAPLEDIAGTALVRVRWRYLPGSDLFIVYRHPFDFHRRTQAADPLVTLKLSYWYDVGL